MSKINFIPQTKESIRLIKFQTLKTRLNNITKMIEKTVDSLRLELLQKEKEAVISEINKMNNSGELNFLPRIFKDTTFEKAGIRVNQNTKPAVYTLGSNVYKANFVPFLQK